MFLAGGIPASDGNLIPYTPLHVVGPVSA